MPLVAQFLAVAAVMSFGLSFWAAYVAWPKFKNLERRGDLKKPVPDLLGNGNTNSFRAWSLIWTTRIPDDRPKLHRLVLSCRGFQLAGIAFMFTAMVVTGLSTPSEPSSDYAPDSPPPVTLTLADQDY